MGVGDMVAVGVGDRAEGVVDGGGVTDEVPVGDGVRVMGVDVAVALGVGLGVVVVGVAGFGGSLRAQIQNSLSTSEEMCLGDRMPTSIGLPARSCFVLRIGRLQ